MQNNMAVPSCYEDIVSMSMNALSLLMESSGDNFISLSVFHLTMLVLKASENFGKIAILKICELIFLGDVKSHFGKLALK